MSTRAQQAQLIRSTAFLDQVQGALLAAAAQILQEAVSTENHENRVKWANAIYVSPTQQAAFFVPAMLTNATIAASDWGQYVNSEWNALQR